MTRAARTKTTATGRAAPGTAGRPQPPTGVWLLAGTRDEEQPYPCMCHGQKACTKWCPCRGREDLDNLPANCCVRRAAEAEQQTDSGEQETPWLSANDSATRSSAATTTPAATAERPHRT